MTKLLCNICKNYLYDLTCEAFPDGIPEEIITGDNDHLSPLPEQENDIVYDPIE